MKSSVIIGAWGRSPYLDGPHGQFRQRKGMMVCERLRPSEGGNWPQGMAMKGGMIGPRRYCWFIKREKCGFFGGKPNPLRPFSQWF
jgi:hypothetical protein